MITLRTNRTRRTGGIYIAVLGTSLIVAVLGLAAMVAQRIHNRTLTASADTRQAQLNAHTALELALLTKRENNNWRSLLDGSNYLFSGRSTGTSSTCSVQVTNASADPATATADLPVKLLAIGNHGAPAGAAPRTAAAQCVEVTVDPRRVPHDSLKNGNSTAPTWATIFAHYQSIGTAINPTSLGPPNLARNGDLVLTTISSYWTGNITGIADDADVQRVDFGGSQYLRVYNREGSDAGGAQPIYPLIKPNKTYTASIRVRSAVLTPSDRFRISFYADPSSGSAPITRGAWSSSSVTWWDGWRTSTVQFTTPNWTSTQLANCIVIVQSLSHSSEFYLDDLTITEDTSEKYIYRQVLNASNNPYGTANANGIYYIDCANTHTVVIERSRIVGTLLVINPAANSRIGDGPTHLSPHTPGYPVLLVNGAFTIQPTAVDLSESTNAFNYNPSDDSDISDTYPLAEAIRGLVAVSGNLTYANSPRITGRVIVGGSTSGTPTFTYRPDSLLNPPPPLGGFYTYRFDRRPASLRKAVQ